MLSETIDVVAGLQQRRDGVDGRHAGGEGKCGRAAFDRRDVALRAPMRVGFCVRAYSKPLCTPSSSWT